MKVLVAVCGALLVLRVGAQQQQADGEPVVTHKVSIWFPGAELSPYIFSHFPVSLPEIDNN